MFLVQKKIAQYDNVCFECQVKLLDADTIYFIAWLQQIMRPQQLQHGSQLSYFWTCIQHTKRRRRRRPKNPENPTEEQYDYQTYQPITSQKGKVEVFVCFFKTFLLPVCCKDTTIFTISTMRASLILNRSCPTWDVFESFLGRLSRYRYLRRWGKQLFYLSSFPYTLYWLYLFHSLSLSHSLSTPFWWSILTQTCSTLNFEPKSHARIAREFVYICAYVSSMFRLRL